MFLALPKVFPGVRLRSPGCIIPNAIERVRMAIPLTRRNISTFDKKLGHG